MCIRDSSGVLKGLTMLGSDFLNNITPIQTNTNANKVPIEVRSPAQLSGKNPPKMDTKKNKRTFDFQGVRNFSCKSENTFGNNPS